MRKLKVRHLTNNVQYGRQQTREQWIKAARALHNDTYDYRLVTEEAWDGRHRPIPVICRLCGLAFETNINHGRKVKSSSKTECKCRRPKKISNRQVSMDEIQRRLLLKHGKRFEILEQRIETLNDQIKVWCNQHSLPFTTTTASLLESKNGCARCPRINPGRAHKPKNYSKVIERKIAQYEAMFEGCGYTYESFVETFEATKGRKISVICPIHHEFKQDAYPSHWTGCPDCISQSEGQKRLKYNPDSFRKVANAITMGYYDLSETVYLSGRRHVTIGCPKHRRRTCMPIALLRGGGCSACSAAENRWYWDRYKDRGGTIDELIARLKLQL